MKQLLICAGILIAATASLSAQQKPPASPSETATATIAGKSITITYNSPRVKGREGHVFTSDGLIEHTTRTIRSGAEAPMPPPPSRPMRT